MCMSAYTQHVHWLYSTEFSMQHVHRCLRVQVEELTSDDALSVA